MISTMAFICAEKYRPWRAYAVMHIWKALENEAPRQLATSKSLSENSSLLMQPESQRAEDAIDLFVSNSKSLALFESPPANPVSLPELPMTR